MTEELKNALITIAKYVGWEVVEHSDTKATLFERNGLFKFISHVKDETTFKYHTSADALLPVWNKITNRIIERSDLVLSREARLSIQQLIIDMNYETACIKLAEIIKQLK